MKHFLSLATLIIAGFFAYPAHAVTCLIVEYRQIATDSRGTALQVPLEPRVAVQSIAFTTPAASAAFNASTYFVRIVCDAKAYFRFSTAGTNAAVSDPFMPANTPEYFGVMPATSPSLTLKVSFYDGTS